MSQKRECTNRLSVLKKIACLMLSISVAHDAWANADDLFNIPLDQLGDIEITSVSKREEKASKAASALFVLNREDIRRSRANSVPELLRMVPGLEVARVNSKVWAVSARGFNNVFANKLLVLIDGRTVYSTLDGGVYWDLVDILIDDIERIEVIRGPGATVWGVNAVNGVINIITKLSKDQKGNFVTLGGGSQDPLNVGGRTSVQLDEAQSFRLYAKEQMSGATRKPDGSSSYDRWDRFLGGFRYDSTPSESDAVTVHGGLQFTNGEERQVLTFLEPPYSYNADVSANNRASNLLARWEHDMTDGSKFDLQGYYSQYRRGTQGSFQRSDTFDIESQYIMTPIRQNLVTIGTGYRHINEMVTNRFYDRDSFYFDNAADSRDIVNGFVQDEITIIEDRLKATIGTKVEHNKFTGYETQPSARLAYFPNETSTIWSSYSRAVQVPSRTLLEIRNFDFAALPTESGIPAVLRLQGNRDLLAEKADTYEIGFRTTLNPKVTFDLATFYSHHQDLISVETGNPQFVGSPSPHLEVPVNIKNSDCGSSQGFESVITWDPEEWWRIQTWYSFLKLDVNEEVNGNSPQNQAMLRMLVTPLEGVEVDPSLHYYDSLPGSSVDSYFQFDLRIGYKITEGLVLSVVGQDLLKSRHSEFNADFSRIEQAKIERAVFARIDWRF